MRFLLAFIFLFTQTTWGQTVGKNAEFNSVSGADYYTNFVINESAKKNTANTVTSNATVARGTTNKIDNVASFTVDASAQNGYVEFTLGTVYDPATSGNCEFKGVFKGDGTLYKAQIVDGSGNLLNQTPVLTNETNWRPFSVTYPCAASGSRKVRITQTESGTAPAFSVGKLYYGQITNLQAGVPPNTFTASISSTGVVSSETGNPDWISGNCVVSDTSLFTCTFVTSTYTNTPNCQVTSSLTADLSPNGVSVVLVNNGTNASQVQYRTSNSGSNSALNAKISCTKTGSDFIQPAITPAQWDYDWTNYTPTISAFTGTFPTYTLNRAQHARIGGKLYLRGSLTMTGTNTWTSVLINFPSGLTSLNSSGTFPNEISFNSAGNNSYKGSASYNGTTQIFIGSLSGTNGAGLGVNQGSPFTWKATDAITWFAGPIDIVGWTTSSAAPQLVGSVIADTNVKAEKGAGITTVDYGTYSATVTNSTNSTPITTPITCTYNRIGSTVTVYCPTAQGCSSAGGTLSAVSVTLPIATTQGSTISGVIGTLISGEVGRVQNNGANLAQLTWTCNQIGSTTRTMTFQYQVP